MASTRDYQPVKGSEYLHPKDHKQLDRTAANEMGTVTLVLRRRPDGQKLRALKDFSAAAKKPAKTADRSNFAAAHGADPKDLDQVAAFARANHLEVMQTHAARRSVVVRGSVADLNKAFGVQLHDYQSPRGTYRGHEGPVNLPKDIAGTVEAVIGLDNRQVPAQHFSTARRKNPDDPPNTRPLTPQQVAKLYNFPGGDGAGQTIGIYEMATADGPAGYTTQDLTQTMAAFGGGLKVPNPIDVSIDGVTNSGVSDGETGLDITVAGAIAQAAQIAVYFTGGTSQNILHAMQTMIHPDQGDPQPTVISISYGWGPDDPSANSLSDQEYAQLDSLFQDAANLSLTVLVSSGDSGAFVQSQTVAQTSYPASDPWVIACGGTTIGNINGSNFDEYAWNDSGTAGPGASGGGVSARFPVPDYQQNAKVPNRISTNQPGRGVPDIAGNASENSGYPQVINGQSQPVGGTSAVAPLYAGLIAIINANLGRSVGFINANLYSVNGVFRDIVSPPGPGNNSFGLVQGYPVGPGWDACTGFGSVNGTALQNALQSETTGSKTVAA